MTIKGRDTNTGSKYRWLCLIKHVIHLFYYIFRTLTYTACSCSPKFSHGQLRPKHHQKPVNLLAQAVDRKWRVPVFGLNFDFEHIEKNLKCILFSTF
jgi:hypothetical protein